MGYRSEVVIKFNDAAAEVMEAARKLDPGLDSILKDNENPEYKNVVYYSSIKWYEGYKDIGAILNILNQLDIEDFGFMRIGEDPDDVEELGSPWEYDISINRSLSW